MTFDIFLPKCCKNHPHHEQHLSAVQALAATTRRWHPCHLCLRHVAFGGCLRPLPAWTTQALALVVVVNLTDGTKPSSSTIRSSSACLSQQASDHRPHDCSQMILPWSWLPPPWPPPWGVGPDSTTIPALAPMMSSPCCPLLTMTLIPP